jgi:hypothetical protein
MSESLNQPASQPNGTSTMPPTEVRQGQTGMGVRYVLVISLGAAIVILAVVYLLGLF